MIENSEIILVQIEWFQTYVLKFYWPVSSLVMSITKQLKLPSSLKRNSLIEKLEADGIVIKTFEGF